MTKPTTMVEWLENKIQSAKAMFDMSQNPAELSSLLARQYALDDALAKAKELEAETCEWKRRQVWDHINGHTWDTGCGIIRSDHNPDLLMHADFCQHCGSPVIEDTKFITEGEVK